MNISGEATPHVAIFDLEAEEDLVITLFNLFKLSGFKVSLCLSNLIWNNIKEELLIADSDHTLIFEPQQAITSIFQATESFLCRKKVNLVIMPSIAPHSYLETRLTITLMKTFPVCAGIFDYHKWFSRVPPLHYNGLKILKRSIIRNWVFNRMVFKYINSFFISDPHRDSSNPLKKLIKTRASGSVIDLPFKVSNTVYAPNFNYSEPVFCVPGTIERHRRDYHTLINIFTSTAVSNLKWKLIILGRPMGQYGQNILSRIKSINHRGGAGKIKYFTEYITKSEYDQTLSSSTHILAPIKTRSYKHGKDTGSIYDVFKFNKIGIFPNHYFYDHNLIEKDALITYDMNVELRRTLENIIKRTYDYNSLREGCKRVGDYFTQERYLEYIRANEKFFWNQE